MIYETIGEVKGIFASPNVGEVLNNTQKLNSLRRMGDWFHYVASLVNERMVDKSLLEKVGVTKEIRNFCGNIHAHKCQHPAHLKDAWKWWANLERF